MQPEKQDSGPEQALYPLTFDPVFKDYPWGGRNLATQLGRDIPLGIIAESWDIAAHPNGSSTVRNGDLCGRTLPEVMDAWGVRLVGTRNSGALQSGTFPLLIKVLDANAWLSVQVHPGDEYALRYEGEYGKTEMWVILHAEPGAQLIYGFKPGVTKEAFADAVARGETAEWLYRLPVQEGDVVFVPAGAIHALGPGILVAEIQQNSDTTYRIYDWGRARPLHIEKALGVLDFGYVEPKAATPVLVEKDGLTTELIGECAYFRTERLHLQAGTTYRGLCNGSTFEIWGVVQGTTDIASAPLTITLTGVDWALLPAALGKFAVTAATDATLLRVITPEPGD